MELIIENIRCFAGRHTIPIKPITLLTGENSSGKSTFLASLAAVNNDGFPLRPRFNEPPYSLGNFDTIATYKGGRYGKAGSFSLGYLNVGVSEMVASYINQGGLVKLSQLSFNTPRFNVNIYLALKGDKFSLSLEVAYGEEHASFLHETSAVRVDARGRRFGYEYLIFFALNEIKLKSAIKDVSVINEIQESLDIAVDFFDDRYHNDQLVSVAPIRTKPKRTYDQVTEEFTPEGEHIPFVLSSLLAEKATKETLERFGNESGLFSQINIKKLGSKISDPIQVLVTNAGRPANLVDVGYGVSQALPVIVESLLASRQSILLLQQPEVHLHPRAQAALGSLFVDLHRENNKQFVVETHSDYIIDRVRQEVARGRVDADDVQILYFEKHGSETQVFPIAIDKRGNVVDPPPSYRDFFMEEEMNLLSRARD